MEAAIFDCPKQWRRWLPQGVSLLESPRAAAERTWALLVLTGSGCRRLGEEELTCKILLTPGECPEALARLRAETVISYGLSPRDSLTLSSLETPVLCVQRTLPRLDGTLIEPQELLLPTLPGPAEALLPILGLRLLQMPQTDGTAFW